MAKIVRIHRPGGPEVLQLDEIELGRPGPGEVRIKVEAIGLNRAEAIYRTGAYIQPPSYPALIGYEGSGIVIEAGEGVAGFKPGDAVCVVPSFRQGAHGIYGEEAIIPARSVEPRPAGLSAIEGAAVWMPYMTAMGIVEIGRIGPGDFVIITAASSSVGIAAIQIANAVGAVPIAATRHSDKADALTALGAKHVIATAEQDLVAETMRITGGKGARIVFDPVAGPYVETLAKATAEEGIIFIYGSLSNEPTVFPHWDAAFKGLSLRGWVASSIWNKTDRFARAKQFLFAGLAAGTLKPVISKIFPLAEIADAHRYLEGNAQVGKVVVTV